MGNKILDRPQKSTPRKDFINEYINSLFELINRIDNSISDYHKLLIAKVNTQIKIEQTPFFQGEDNIEYNFYQEVLEELNQKI